MGAMRHNRDELKAYLSGMSTEEVDEIAIQCGTTGGHLRNVLYGKTCAPVLATALEDISGGLVTRRGMRPDDYADIWPDLREEGEAHHGATAEEQGA